VKNSYTKFHENVPHKVFFALVKNALNE
jgi:hypothetical protein